MLREKKNPFQLERLEILSRHRVVTIEQLEEKIKSGGDEIGLSPKTVL